MTMTQFAMVEELASLVKDNLPCKHLILSVEEALVSFLQDDTSSEGVIELEPMNSYNRLLLHRLADIFGFAHESIGQGDDRHLVLERHPETSIPPILVSDILWQYDESLSPTTSHQLLRRTEATFELKTNTSSTCSFEEREAAYMAARDRIFSVGEGERKEPDTQKPRTVPVVARRMIAHALGRSVNPCGQEKDSTDSTSSCDLSKDSKLPEEHDDEKFPDVAQSGSGNGGLGVKRDNLRGAHLGAAKRIFAHALGRRSG